MTEGPGQNETSYGTHTEYSRTTCRHSHLLQVKSMTQNSELCLDLYTVCGETGVLEKGHSRPLIVEWETVFLIGTVKNRNAFQLSFLFWAYGAAVGKSGIQW